MGAVQTCDFTTLNKAAACFDCMSVLEKQAALVFFLNRRLGVLNGAGPQTPNALRSQTTAFIRGSVDPLTDAMDALIAQKGAVAAGDAAAGTLTMAQIRAQINAFAHMSYQELRAMELLLRCNLNQFP